MARLPHVHQQRPLLLGGDGIAQHVGVADDDVERGAQLVRHRRHELGLELARALELLDDARVHERHRRELGDAGRRRARSCAEKSSARSRWPLICRPTTCSPWCRARDQHGAANAAPLEQRADEADGACSAASRRTVSRSARSARSGAHRLDRERPRRRAFPTAPPADRQRRRGRKSCSSARGAR